jgi:hypothetical protein
MILADDIRAHDGMLLLARGHEITAGILLCLQSNRRCAVKEPIRVVMPGDEPAHGPVSDAQMDARPAKGG